MLPGAGPNHHHGLLGRLPDGSPRIAPTPLPPGGLSQEEHRDSHRGFCFNSRLSDSLPLDREQRDVRSPGCAKLHESYPKDLPSASVVIVFHNENLSVLLRSVHSVLNHSPAHLLVEVILVDDASVPVSDRFYERHWRRLQDELTEYCRALPKVRLVRLKERRGLMVARMEGVWRARGEVAIFLDSHIEATSGWIEPLLARMKADPLVVVVPSIDSIGNDDFGYHAGGGLGVLGFSWTLGQMPSWADTGPEGTQPAASPVMAGGLFASDRRWFLKLGGYDPEMRLYGGEEMEIGFRTWMCGGRIEYIPCSHVGHVFRSGTWWQGQVYKVPGEEIARNKLRTAEVWMDEYKALVQYATAPLPASLPLGDVEPRRELRRKLKCKDFGWYLQHVTPNMYVPRLSKDARGGSLQNEAKSACIDSLGSTTPGAQLGVYPCHGQHGTQALVMDGDGMVRIPQTGYSRCMTAEGAAAVIGDCGAGPKARWTHSAPTRQFASTGGDCLEFAEEATPMSPYTLRLAKCEEGKVEQKWFWAK